MSDPEAYETLATTAPVPEPEPGAKYASPATTSSAPVPAKKKGLWRTYKSAPWSAKLAIVWLVFVIGSAIYAKLDGLLDQKLPLQDPYVQGNLFGTAQRLESPSSAHWLGTDGIARDSFSRILHGGWVSLVVAFSAAAFGIIIGGLVGSFVGYVRGRWETSIMALMDVILAFPALVLLLALVSIWEVRSLALIGLVIGVLSIPVYTRIARASSLAISNREFIQAAEAIGTKRRWILLREVIPNVLPVLFAYALVQAGYVIVLEGTLSFLGLSVQPPESTWGNMINEGRAEIRQTILPVLWPALWMSLTVLSLNQTGDWLQRRAAVKSSAL